MFDKYNKRLNFTSNYQFSSNNLARD